MLKKGAALFIFFFAISHHGSGQNKADSLFLADTDDSIKVGNLLSHAWEQKYNNPDRALEAVNLAIRTAEQAKSPRLTGDTYYYKGMLYYLTTRLDSARNYADQALEYYRMISYDYGIASIYNLNGLIDEKRSDYQGAIENYLLSARYAKNTDNLYSQSNPLHNIGLVYEKIDQYGKSLEYYEKALELRLALNDSSFIASSYMSISSAHQYLKHDSLAIAYARKAIAIFEKLGDVYNLMIAYNNLGHFYLLRDELEQADYFMEKSIGLVEPEVYPENYILSSANRIIIKNRQQKYREAVEIGEYSLKIARKYDLKWNEKEILSELVQSYYALKSLEKAYHTQQRLLHLSDSLLNEENLAYIARLETQYRTQEKDYQLLRQKIELSEKKSILQLQVAIIVFLVLLVALLLIWMSFRKKKQLLLNQLALNEERSRIAMDLHDHLGAELTIISSRLDTRAYQAKNDTERESLEDISNQVRKAGNTLRETVWSIRSEAINVADLLSRVETFSQQLLGDKDIRFLVDTNVPEFRLTSIQALDIYRIIQEAITNAGKYAEASVIRLEVHKDATGLICKVIDDGAGFDPDRASEGFGLQNMRQRAESLGGVLNVNSASGTGTTITFRLPADG